MNESRFVDEIKVAIPAHHSKPEVNLFDCATAREIPSETMLKFKCAILLHFFSHLNLIQIT